LRVWSGLGDAEPFVLLEVAFAVEPVIHRRAQAVERDAIAYFQHAVGDGEGVVEGGVVGEIAHGEVIQPLDGAGQRWCPVGDGDFALEDGGFLCGVRWVKQIPCGDDNQGGNGNGLRGSGRTWACRL
jgi:hypothetical protein